MSYQKPMTATLTDIDEEDYPNLEEKEDQTHTLIMAYHNNEYDPEDYS